MANGADLLTDHTLLVVAAALLDSERRVLLAQVPTGKAHAGAWEFPGGKVERGERPEAALVRELAEELGIAVAEADLEPALFARGETQGHELTLLLFLCRRWAGEPQGLEGAALRWELIERLGELPWTPADVPLAARLPRLL